MIQLQLTREDANILHTVITIRLQKVDELLNIWREHQLDEMVSDYENEKTRLLQINNNIISQVANSLK
jgi:hypothetical protein